MPYIKNKHFAPDIFYKDIDCSNYEKVVKQFEKRIKCWYIDPAKILLNRTLLKTVYSFPTVSICCTLIDLIAGYYDFKSRRTRTDFINFLNSKFTEFNQTLSFPIDIKIYEYNGNIGNNPVHNYGEIFYYCFRNGIVHNAMILTNGRITKIEDKSKLCDWDTNNKILTVDPHKLIEKIEDFFNQYIQTLIDKSDDDLVENFKNKFIEDFGESIDPKKRKFKD